MLTQSDEWYEWLLHHRHADDPAYGEVVSAVVAGYVDRLLDRAQLVSGMTLIDVGAGEGVLAFRAIDRVGASLRAVFADISAPLLRHAQQLAVRRGVAGQCSFVECSAERLGPIGDGIADVVATRAALAYVADKNAALREFFRVLKPGGRLCIAEPILQDEAFYVRALRKRIDELGPARRDRFLELLHRWKAAQYPDTEEGFARSPHVNFSERDLLNLARGCGFTEIHLQLHIDVVPALSKSWEVFLGSSPHPWAPPLKRILAEQFSAEERQYFERLVRPTVESGQNLDTDRIVYLDAKKPAT